MRYRRSPEEQALYDRLELTVGCVHCPDWSHTGPAGEAREAARAHRAERHPELPLVAVRPRKRQAPVQQSPSSADQKLVATLAERRRTMGSVSRSLLTEKRLDEATRRYDAGESVREIASGRFEAWGYSTLDSLAVALYRLLPDRVRCWRGRSAGSPRNGRAARLSEARSAVVTTLYEAHWSLGQIAYLVSERWGFPSLNAARAELGRTLKASGVELRGQAPVECLPEISRAQAVAMIAAADGARREAVFEGRRDEELAFRGVALEAV